MNHNIAPPGARVLWCLRRRSSDVRCVAFFDDGPIEVRVLQGDDLVITERFLEPAAALDWAEQYGAQLRAHGWSENP